MATMTIAAALHSPTSGSSHDGSNNNNNSRLTNRMTNRYSVNAMYSLAAEQDVEIEDDLARAQKRLRDLKSRISTQSKKNFVLERDVRYLDSRIALLIANRMAADEKREVAEALDEVDEDSAMWPDEKKMGQYANLFFLLQSEPRHVASLCRLVSLQEIDTLLQTVMFTLYGNQYEQREEHLLLTMFQVCPLLYLTLHVSNSIVGIVGTIRDDKRIWITATRKHTRIANDDDLHKTRSRSIIPQNSARRSHQ
jgi:Ras GTPase-activating-like protein IQGAP2/3